MHTKVEALLNRLKAERAGLSEHLNQWGGEAHQEWEKAEDKWLALQGRMRDSGLELAEKAGNLIENFEGELRELRDEASSMTWKLNFKTKDEIHDMGEGVDKLQHKVVDKLEDVRVEVMEELHDMGEEIAVLYGKIRGRFRHE